MLKILILQTQHNLSGARMEFMIDDRLSLMRFLGSGVVIGLPIQTSPTIAAAA
ncbi:transposase [Devosia oryzisoli]|uniref:transposase n=1 Tax=Devosia oryzisoli TaxID=2774138 RepID=UPI0020C119CF|nr:transposase [Devosia oryzisoli]